VDIIERAHPDLGRLGVFWHTQGSGKSYSMAFFAEKVRRKLPGDFTFLLMTDRNDLDNQIYRTFIGCGVADSGTPRAASGADLERLLKQNHRYVFSLIHKFNQDVNPKETYSDRDDIIVISDEAHRTQAGRLARNMRLALPNAAFIGFTGTPLFKQDEITKRIFGDYVSRYDFKRSEEDGATVKLVYENRGEKLGVVRTDLNDRIAAKIEEAELDPDQAALLDKLLGKDYEVITADERLDKIAADFVEHCATRWDSGKSMLVCIDKITCARLHQRIMPRWKAKAAEVRAAVEAKRLETMAESDHSARAALLDEARKLEAQAAWLDETIVEIIISEAQNEVADFKKWGFDIIPHRALMKQGFDAGDGQRVDVETAFKAPQHPFRVAIVCAMWLTGFDVECLSTLYIDKPMKAHALMQAIARANRVYPGKDFGLIVDYNGMLASLRAALAQYALGDDGTGGEEIVAPIVEQVQALLEAIEATEAHLRGLGFDPATLIGCKGFARIKGLADAVEAVHSTDETWRSYATSSRRRSDARPRRFRISGISSSGSWRRCSPATLPAWTTSGSTRKSSPTIIGRRVGRLSRRRSGSCSSSSTASTRNRSGRPRRGSARTNSRCSTSSWRTGWTRPRANGSSRPAGNCSPQSRHAWRNSIGFGRRSRPRRTSRFSSWTRCLPASRRRPSRPTRRQC
jgi:type I restriction enzyme R subunit